MVKVLSNLILPKSYEMEARKLLSKAFKSRLEKEINEHQHIVDPYFISYHETDDRITGDVNNCWAVTIKMPRFLARQIVYWVDNKKGFKEWLWNISDEKKPYFNIEGVRKAKASGALRVPKKVSA